MEDEELTYGQRVIAARKAEKNSAGSSAAQRAMANVGGEDGFAAGSEQGDGDMCSLFSRYLVHHVEENGPLELPSKAAQKKGGPWLSESDDPSDSRSKEEKVLDALMWIDKILTDNDVEYVVAGGVAARVHGAEGRPLWDIDIHVLDADLKRLAAIDDIQEKLQEMESMGPDRYVEEPWDILSMKLFYRGQCIDFTGVTTCRYFNGEDWIDISRKVQSTPGVFDDGEEGVEIPVIPLDELVKQKKLFGREVDIADVLELQELEGQE